MLKRANRIYLFALPLSVALSLTIYLILNLPSEPDRTELELYFRAVQAYENGDFQQCLNLTEALSKGNPSFFQAGLLEAKALFFSNRINDAEARLRRLIAKKSNYFEAEIWLLRCLIREENFTDAENLGEELLSRAPESLPILGMLAGLSETDCDYRSAIEYYKRAALHEEELAVNRVQLAKLYSSLLNNEEADQQLKRALCLMSENSPLRSAVELLLAKPED